MNDGWIVLHGMYVAEQISHTKELEELTVRPVPKFSLSETGHVTTTTTTPAPTTTTSPPTTTTTTTTTRAPGGEPG